MAATTANYTQVTTDALNAAVAAINNLKNDTLTTLPPQEMGEISSQIAFSSAGIKPSGFLVARVSRSLAFELFTPYVAIRHVVQTIHDLVPDATRINQRKAIHFLC